MAKPLKVHVYNDQIMTQSERNAHSINRGGKSKILILRKQRKQIEQLFPNRQPLSYPN